MGKEKIGKTDTLGAIIMGIGALIILIPDEMVFNRGDFLILAGSAIAPFANYYQKKARTFCSSETILGFRTVVGLPFVLLLAWIFEPELNYDNFILALPYILIIGTAIYVVSKHKISVLEARLF